MNKNKKIGVISSEFLSGNLYLNGGMDSKVYADRLKLIFPKAKILIVIREQSSFFYILFINTISHIMEDSGELKSFWSPNGIL